jgi:hypothetical protein
MENQGSSNEEQAPRGKLGLYEAFREIEDLTDMAKTFYKVTGS